MTTPKSKALKLKVKHGRSDYGFDRSYKVLQGAAKKHGETAHYLHGYSKSKRAAANRKPIDAADIPF